MGPIALFDKSFLQSLSLDESVFFDHFFLPVICPLFYIETLADLEKRVRQGRTPEQEVGIIADKVPEMGGEPCAYHMDMAIANLFGAEIAMDGRVYVAGGRPVKVDGKSGFVYERSPEAEAFNRWRDRDFLSVERQFASQWRVALNSIDLATIAAGVQAMGINPKTCKTLADAKDMVTGFLNQSGDTVSNQIKLALIVLGVPSEHESAFVERWRGRGKLSLATYAPYTAHVVGVELFFQIALGAELIGTADANNRTDIGYLFYAPFCHVFISSDRLQQKCASHFLRNDQTFVWGQDLKADLKRLMDHFATYPEEEKARGLKQFAPTPLPADKDGLVGKLWDKHLLPWRERAAGTDTTRSVEQDPELIAHLNRISAAPSLEDTQVDFDPANPDFIHLTRSVHKRKGSWWQLPRDLKD